jgi:HTH-type transcriptional regulator/antitoxin HigA
MLMTEHAPAEAGQTYLSLLQAHQPRPIHTDAELDAAIALLDDFLDRATLTPDEEDFLELLSALVENYERDHVAIPLVSGVAVLRHLMEENGLTQADLAADFGGKSVVSEVLSGKRALSKTHVRKLSERFGLPSDVFLRE